MPPAYVMPYVKRQKNDATDAEAVTSEHAVCSNQDTGAAELPDAPSHAPSVHSPDRRSINTASLPTSCRRRRRLPQQNLP